MGKGEDTDMKVTRGRGEIVPKDFAATVRDIKLAILQARARAAQVSNVEALKLYFYVGGYISKKTRAAKWGSGAINALSERLQVELPGLRGFSPSAIKRMRLLFEAWENALEFRPLPMVENSSEGFGEIRPLPMVKLAACDIAAFLSVGFTHHSVIIEKVKEIDRRWYYIRACAKEHWPVIELERHIAANDYRHVGALPNNFARLLPMAQATRAVRSFRDEYLLELVNLDNVDAIHDQDVDERVLSKGLVANIEKSTASVANLPTASGNASRRKAVGKL